MQRPRLVLLTLLVSFIPLWAQSPTATIDGRVLDPTRAVIDRARVEAINIDTNVRYSTDTNSAGLFTIVNLPPGAYRVEVTKPGFRTIVNPGIVLHVQDVLALNFEMPIGSTLESITVKSETPLVNTTDASVSTVVDRNFAENLPLNGRSFQTLIELTPGVVPTTSGVTDAGQFSVNGQRATSNYWTVDGVSANTGIGVNQNGNPGNGLSGSIGSFSATGGTNSLVSVDAIQEFRIQTSTYSPEFGRTPGAQISLVTRSGSNQFHGTLFDYFRNDALDANDWFADQAHLPKPQERQNDFGGTLGGPIVRNKTFFFGSFEGLRLRLPQVLSTDVPDLSARQSALPAIQPFLNAFPVPNGADDAASGTAQFHASFSNKSTLDAYSIRVDHRLSNKLTVFGRYSYSPSEIDARGGTEPSILSIAKVGTQTITTGNTWALSTSMVNDIRFNYSRTDASGFGRLDTFGGAAPLSSLPLPSPFTPSNANFQFFILSLSPFISIGPTQHELQRQINLVDSTSVQKGSHSLKLGVDFRRLSPLFDPPKYTQAPFFPDVSSAESGNLAFSIVTASRGGTLLFRNLGLFAQDTWRLHPRLTLTYGIRWDVDFAPTTENAFSLPAPLNFNSLSQLGIAPVGTPAFHTPFANVGPRLGLAYELSQNQRWQTVLRGGVGLFYDLATSETGNSVFNFVYPFGNSIFTSGGRFPLDPATAAPSPISPNNLSSGSALLFDPNLKLPRVWNWSLAVEQTLGADQRVSASYIGSAGRRLLQTEYVFGPSANVGTGVLVRNHANADYDALQLQFQRRLLRGLQALASYSWSHSIDTASAGSWGIASNTFVPLAIAGSNRGSSDFDIRHAFSAGLTYNTPAPRTRPLVNIVVHGWSLQSVIQARSASPVNVFDSIFVPGLQNFVTAVRPDTVPGQSFYLYGKQYPGDKILNASAFMPPPVDSSGQALRQGDLGRNALRGFGATQWDAGIHRDFAVGEAFKLQFRAELFNLLNHPNFGPPVSDTNSAQFGYSTQTLAHSLDHNTGGGGFSSLYQVGGSRSVQLALKLFF
jgi:hypothetical protein